MSATFFGEMSLARLDWRTHRKVPTRSLCRAHIGVFARLWRHPPIAISAHHRRTDQKTVHLGPRAFDQRYPFLSASRLVRPSLRVDARFSEHGQLWAGRICTCRQAAPNHQDCGDGSGSLAILGVAHRCRGTALGCLTHGRGRTLTVSAKCREVPRLRSRHFKYHATSAPLIQPNRR
jgi:hypothetical protein